MFLKNCEFGGFPSTTSIYVKESVTFKQLKELSYNGAIIQSAKTLIFVNYITTMLQEANLQWL